MYHKFPDILDEFRVYCGMPRLYPERQQRSETVATEKDVEAGKLDVVGTPTKTGKNIAVDDDIRCAPTNIESPASLNDDSSMDDSQLPRTYQQERLNNNKILMNTSVSTVSDDDYVAKYMKHRKLNSKNMPSPSDKSGSMADSVYFDASYLGNDNQTASLGSPFSKAKFNPAYNTDTEELDYSMDTMDNNYSKECFSSYARPNNATMTSTLAADDDTAIYSMNANNNKFAHSLFSKYNDDVTTVSHLGEGDAKTSPVSSRVGEDVSDPTGVSSQSYSPLGRRNVTFSSQLLEESCINCSPEVVLKQCEDAIVTIKRNAMAVINGTRSGSVKAIKPAEINKREPINPIAKPQYTIVTKKSLMDSFTDDDSDNNDRNTNPNNLFNTTEQGPAEENVVAEVTPTFTVSTAGLWSPSSDASSVVTPCPSDESFGSRDNVVKIDVDGGLDMSTDDEGEPKKSSPSSHPNVHVCKSAACAACRQPKQNTPKFVPAKQISSSYESNLRPKVPPKRWWMDDSKLRQYVSSAMLPVSKFRTSITQGSTEEKPFDEP